MRHRPLALALFLLLAAAPARAQHAADSSQAGSARADTAEAAYRIYTSEGEAATLEDVVEAMAGAEVVFAGEVHRDPTAHALQQKLFEAAYARRSKLALSLEMFERDVQPVLDEYLGGYITEEHFLRSSRPWANYQRAYRPLVEFAKAHALPVLAANAPRRYVNRVAREGRASLAALPPAAQAWLPPLPYPGPSPAYQEKWNALMQEAMPPGTESPHGAENPHASSETAPDSGAARPHGRGTSPENLLAAQALWDAAMAFTLARFLTRQPGTLVFHVTGGFHAEEGAGTPEQLTHYRPGTRALVLAMQPVRDVKRFQLEQHGGLGDFIVLTEARRVRSETVGR